MLESGSEVLPWYLGPAEAFCIYGQHRYTPKYNLNQHKNSSICLKILQQLTQIREPLKLFISSCLRAVINTERSLKKNFVISVTQFLQDKQLRAVNMI